MRTISNKEARESQKYRKIMAAALWAYRSLKAEGPNLFVYDGVSPRNLSFCSSASAMIVDTVVYDRLNGQMWVNCMFFEEPSWRTIMIFE